MLNSYNIRPTIYEKHYLTPVRMSGGVAANMSIIKWVKKIGFEFGLNKQFASPTFEGMNEYYSKNQKTPIKSYFNLIYRF